MFVQATRAAPRALVRLLALAGLFILVVVLQTGVTSALRAIGLDGGLALTASGAGVLALVLGVHLASRARARRAADALEAARRAQGLPDGPCCLVWRAPSGAGGDDMPWDLTEPLRVAYPAAARRLGIEGLAVLEFEIGADGAAKHIICLEAWPAPVFAAAATRALSEARFQLRWGAEPRFGASFRMPFVFRVAGAAKIKERGHRARAPRLFGRA